jgi:diguanylate cyclase (GGDEF)-like protein
MNLVPRQDRLLVAGLALALPIIIFARPIERWVLNFARDAERSGLAFLPALFVLTLVFLMHQQDKRIEARTRAAAAEAAASVAQSRAAEMEQLVAFGQALARSLDLDTIRDAVQQQLPKLAGTDGAWILLRVGSHWQALVPSGTESRRDIERTHQRDAERAIENPIALNPVDTEGHFCLPLMAGGHTVGVLGIPDTAGPFPEARQRMLATVAAVLAIALRNAQLFQEIRETSLRDGLTGCFNRTHALGVIDTELRRARRSQTPVSLIMFDLDHFKDVNDRYGHLCGDAVLAAVGARMRDVLRGSDLKCRYGGEEFLVQLPETPVEGAKRVADTLRREIAEMNIPWKDETVRITASFGVTVALPSEIDTEAFISRADTALYRAKDEGRNCVRLFVEPAVA